MEFIHLKPLHQLFLCVCVYVLDIFEIGSRELFAQAGFKPQSSWSLLPEWLELQVWVTSTWQLLCFMAQQGNCTLQTMIYFKITRRVWRFFFFFFWWDWGLNSGFQACKADALLLEPHHQLILLWLFLEMEFLELFNWLVSSCDPQDLNLPSS
jgi:hypothetical protein